MAATTCQRCDTPTQQVPRGRPRKFCSNRCRQANYRAERTANPTGDAALQAALDDANRRLQAAADAINDPTIWRLIRNGSEAAAAIVAVASHLPKPT